MISLDWEDVLASAFFFYEAAGNGRSENYIIVEKALFPLFGRKVRGTLMAGFAGD